MINYQIALSQRILEKAKKNEDHTELRRELYYIVPRKLEKPIVDDSFKKEFWVSIYNATILIMARESHNGTIDYKKKRIKVARTLLSLDDIKYRILRIPKYTIAFININSFFNSIIIQQLALDKPDNLLEAELYKKPFGRIHKTEMPIYPIPFKRFLNKALFIKFSLYFNAAFL